MRARICSLWEWRDPEVLAGGDQRQNAATERHVALSQ
jgi:hypothetical protein